jgi:glycosyltransferase involved in cell wall biosynthesis
MKIVVIHQYYLMPGRPGGSRFNEFARMWTAAGHEVTVIAGTIDYATGESDEKYRGRWVTPERDGDVEVLRCYVPPTYARSYRGRMLAFLGFILSASTAALRIRRADVVIATSPPLTAVIPGWVAAHVRRRSVPWIFEMRDLWPESAVTTGVLKADGTLTRALYGLERVACRSADVINVLTPAFRDDLIRRRLAGDDHIVFIPNGADVDLFRPTSRDNYVRRDFGWDDKFVVMYAGAHGRANAVSQLVETAALLREHPDVLIACVGDGPERRGLEAEAKKRGLANIAFHGAQPKERMPDFVNACDVGAAVLQDNPTFRTVYPNKVFDYMSCERPSLLAIDGVARKLVCDEARAGVFAYPEKPEAIASAILALRNDPEGRAAMGRRGREWVLANATRDALSKRYLEVLEGLARR